MEAHLMDSITLFDLETGDAVRYFHTWKEGEDALRSIAQSDPPSAARLALVAYDKAGKLIESLSGAGLTPASA